MWEIMRLNSHRDLVDHEVHTVEEAGFKGLENGDLLRAHLGGMMLF